MLKAWTDRLFRREDKRTSYTAQDVGRIVSSYLSGPFSPGMAQEKNYRELVEAYKGWVYTAVDKLGKSIASLPLKLYVFRSQKTGRKILDPSGLRLTLKALTTDSERRYALKEASVQREEVFDHPFLQLMRRPNHLMTRFAFWYETIVRLEVGGLCGWYLVKNRLGQPAEMWPLPLTKDALLRPKVNSDLRIESWFYRDGDVNREFRPDEIVLIKYPNPVNPFQGMSPLMAQTYPYDIDLFLGQQQRALFANMAVPGLPLTTDKTLTPQQVKEIKEQIDEQYAGALKAGRTLVLHSGLKPTERMAMTSREALIEEVGRYAREKLLTSYDLSEGAVGLVRDVNRANMEGLRQQFVQDALRPKTMMIEEVIEEFILPLWDQGLTCDFDLPDIEDETLELQRLQTRLSTGFSTINEEREREGREPVPWGNAPWLPFSLMQPGAAIPPAPPIPARAAQPAEKDLDRAFWTEERKAAHWGGFARRTETHERAVTDALQKHWHTVERDVLTRLATQGKAILGQYAGWARSKVQAHLAKGNGRVSSINVDRASEAKQVRLVVDPILKLAMADQGASLLRLLAAQKDLVDFNVNDPTVLRWLGSRMERFSEQVAGTTFDAIEAVLREGFTEGQPAAQISETLRALFESWDKYRAPLIARTEVIAASNQADLFAVEQAGIADVMLKHWLSSRDAACRETHAEADQRYAENGIGMDEDFQVGADSMPAPGNGSDPGENVNCRCSMYYTRKTT